MLNLLFISNSPKVQYLKSALQPVLKVIIDVVPDFDHGLKDVFEKRPATVCIQDQIAGVTGESVARHIQMLLGAGAPTFILMHDGNSKIKPIKGLFEHVIELNQPDEGLAVNFLETLKTLLGEQWGKIHIPPTPTVASVRSSIYVPQESRENADKLVDDFLLDLESTDLTAAPMADFSVAPDTSIEESITQTSVDEIADMLLAQARQSRQDETVSDVPIVVIAEQDAMQVPPLEKASTAAVDSVFADTGPDEHKCHVKPVQEMLPSPWQMDDMPPAAVKADQSVSEASPIISTPASRTADVSNLGSKPVPEAAVTVAPVAPSAFRISGDKGGTEEPIPEELLLAFEKNYRSKSTYVKRSLLVLLVLIGASAAGWYVFEQKPLYWASFKQRVLPTSQLAVKQPSVAARPMKAEQKKPQMQTSPAITVPALPSFIHQDVRDSSYAVKNPGWERYVGKNHEIRVFRAGVTIKAVQVLSVKDNPLSESFLKSVLKELVGSADYQVNSRETKANMLLLRGTVAQKADVLIYRKKSSLRAFVVSFK